MVKRRVLKVSVKQLINHVDGEDHQDCGDDIPVRCS